MLCLLHFLQLLLILPYIIIISNIHILIIPFDILTILLVCILQEHS